MDNRFTRQLAVNVNGNDYQTVVLLNQPNFLEEVSTLDLVRIQRINIKSQEIALNHLAYLIADKEQELFKSEVMQKAPALPASEVEQCKTNNELLIMLENSIEFERIQMIKALISTKVKMI